MQYNAFVTIECRIVHQLTKIRRQNLASGFKKRGGVSKLIKFDFTGRCVKIDKI